MASYHLSVKTIKRSAGRSATAAAAYRVGERIECQREGRVHEYTRKQGIKETFILTPKDAPDWATDRSRLWNARRLRRHQRGICRAGAASASDGACESAFSGESVFVAIAGSLARGGRGRATVSGAPAGRRCDGGCRGGGPRQR